MIRHAVVGCAVAVAVAFIVQGAAASGLLNPHVKPEPCNSCHAKLPTPDGISRQDFSLLKDSIDATCLVCHEKTCCKAAKTHGHMEHPSGIDTWDKAKFQAPKTVPLYNGYITCSTCHFHSLPEGESFKMVRLVKRDGLRIEWVRLCRDCHTQF